MRNGHIQSAKTKLERLPKQGNTAAIRSVVENEPTVGTRAAIRPFPAKKKATPLNRCRRTEKSKELLEQFLFLLTPYSVKTFL